VNTNTKMLLLGLVQAVVSGLMLFLAAGTFNYWQLWVFLVVAALSTSIPSCYLLRTNPAALQRRMRAGPTAETRMVQKVLIAGWYLSLAAMEDVPSSVELRWRPGEHQAALT
jgi:hypothetical protein